MSITKDIVRINTKSNFASNHPSVELKIQNIITTANLDQHIEITKFNHYEWGRYDLEDNYNGKVGYVKDDRMQGRVTVFLSGKMISTGARSFSKSIDQLNDTVNLLSRVGLAEKTNIEPRCQNVVATIDIKKKLDLLRVAELLSNSIYEPEQFPGLIHKSVTGSTCLIFASGKIVSVGTKSERQLLHAVSHIVNELKQFEIST